MKELSCMKVMLFGAARARAAPSNPPTVDKAEIVSTSRRDAARMIFAIRSAFPRTAYSAGCHYRAARPRVPKVRGRESPKSTGHGPTGGAVSDGPSAAAEVSQTAD